MAPANNPEIIIKFRNLALSIGKNIRIFSPGVGPQGGGPDSAVNAGADFIIAGRAIYQSKDPRKEITTMYHIVKDAYRIRKSDDATL